MKRRFSLTVVVAVVVGLLAPTATLAEGPARAKGFSKLVRMAKAMGGMDKILALEGERITAAGNRFEPEQAFRPGGEAIPVAGYQSVLTQAFGRRQSRNEWFLDILYPLLVQRDYTEIINGNDTAVIGVDTILNVPQAPMLSTRLGARTKHYLVTSPLALIHRAAANPDSVLFLGNEKIEGRPQKVISIPGWGQPIRVFIDSATKLPTQVETLEDDTIYGDAVWRVVFSDWQRFDGVLVPMRRIHYLQSRLINDVTLSAVDLLQRIDEDQFMVPEALKAELNPELFAWGVRSSQWFNRFLALGIPFDLDQTTPESVTIAEVAPGVFHVLGLTHNTMVVEMQDTLVVLEPPLYEQRTQAVLDAVQQRWPDKPIQYIVVSHFHNDHIGGVRGYGAIGATLVVGEGTKAHYEDIFAAPHTVAPDAFAESPRDVEIITVAPDAPFVISDGTRNIKLFDVANIHAIGMIVPYVEDAKLVFVSDLYNPEFLPTPIPPLFSFWSFDLLEGLENSGLDIELLAGAHGGIVTYERFVADVEASR